MDNKDRSAKSMAWSADDDRIEYRGVTCHSSCDPRWPLTLLLFHYANSIFMYGKPFFPLKSNILWWMICLSLGPHDSLPVSSIQKKLFKLIYSPK